MIDLYTWTTPNGRKVSVGLEEMGLAYNVHPVNIGQGEQFKPEFLAISPNNRIPAIVDNDTGGDPVSVFESGAILIYLAEKTGKFLPASGPARAKALEWLMWQMGGVGPMMGQAYHFTMRDEKIEYAINRYIDESLRLLGVLDKQLATHEHMAGDYSIADMATYPWVAAAMPLFERTRAEEVAKLGNVKRWIEALGARPAVQKGMAVLKID